MAQVAVGAQTGAAIGTAVAVPPGAIIGACIGGGVALIGTVALIIYKANSQIKLTKQEAKKLKDPKHFKEGQKKIADQCINQLKKLKFTQQLKKKDNKKDVIFIGITSAGKSSLINNLFETNLKYGVGKTTQNITLAKQQQKFRIWDCVGNDSDFQYFDEEKICFFGQMNIIFILYRFTPAQSQYLIKLIWRLKDKKYQVYFVRTCCDQFDKKQNKTLDQQLESDQKILKEFGVQKPIIFTASSLKNGFQNKMIKQLITK